MGRGRAVRMVRRAKDPRILLARRTRLEMLARVGFDLPGVAHCNRNAMAEDLVPKQKPVLFAQIVPECFGRELQPYGAGQCELLGQELRR